MSRLVLGKARRFDNLTTMVTRLLQLEQRIRELEELAVEVDDLAKKQEDSESPVSGLSTTGQRWYRGAREILVQQKSSCLQDFDSFYRSYLEFIITGNVLALGSKGLYADFAWGFRNARALLAAVMEEVKSRELPVKSQLSFAVSADEFEKSLDLLNSGGTDETFLRAAGVVGRVALERHLWTVVDARGLVIQKNPPNKKKADTQDLLTTLTKESVITPIQKSEFDSLFVIGNNCAHPKEAVNRLDVERLVTRGRELCSVIV